MRVCFSLGTVGLRRLDRRARALIVTDGNRRDDSFDRDLYGMARPISPASDYDAGA